MFEDIRYIQNTLWTMYKQFLHNQDVKEYTNQAVALCKKYAGNPVLSAFCQNQIITWTPIVNGTKEKYNEEQKGAAVCSY